MTTNDRKKTVDSWHMRADAYELLINNYSIFKNMAMGLIKFVEKHQNKNTEHFHVMDLAAGTGLISKLLIEHLHLSPLSLHIVEPAERMCILARDNIKTPHIYQITAEECLSINSLPRNEFDFILCNASMHLMSEDDIYPVVYQLLKPKTGYFIYTVWYHSFDETLNYHADQEFETYVNDALAYFKYPAYFSRNNKNKSTTKRSRKYLNEIANKNGLKLESCTIETYRTPMNFDLDFTLMTPDWLIEHLKIYQWTQTEDIYVMKKRVIEKMREFLKDKYSDVPVVQIIVSRL